MKNKNIFSTLNILLILFLVQVGCVDDSNKAVKDEDCPKEVDIGWQGVKDDVWMSKNLNVDAFSNGERFPEVKTAQQWKEFGEAKKPAWCYFDNNPANGDKYGKLYNWYAVNDPRGLAPPGYHITGYYDWNDMWNNASAMAIELKTQSGWHNSGNGNNTKCFSATPAGYRTADGVFQGITKQTGWWVIPYLIDTTSSTDWVFEIVYDSPQLFLLKNYKSCGYSVRCKKD